MVYDDGGSEDGDNDSGFLGEGGQNPNLLPTNNCEIFDFVRNPEPEDGSPREV